MFPDYNSLKKEWLLYFMEDHYGCWYDGTNCLMGCYFLLFESLKNRIFQGCPGGRMRSLASSLVIAWLTLLGIKAQKIKVWKRAKKTRWPFSSNPGLQATWHQHGAGRDFPQMGQDSNSGAHWDINLSQVKMPLFENQCSQESWMRLFSNCHCSCSCLCQIMVLFDGQVMSPHHPDQMSQSSQFSWVVLLKMFSKCICLCNCLCLFVGQNISDLYSSHTSSKFDCKLQKNGPISKAENRGFPGQSDRLQVLSRQPALRKRTRNRHRPGISHERGRQSSIWWGF